jgi:hypothetical protein
VIGMPTNKSPCPAIAEFETRISGIPCIIQVTGYSETPSDFTSRESDWDYYGEIEIEFNVLDRKGYPAKWLEKKLTHSDNERILSEYQ